MVQEFDSIDKLVKEIRKKLDAPITKKKVVSLYAFNAIGKTRLTTLLRELDSEDESENTSIKALCYNAFLEDMFRWDNENKVLTFNPESRDNQWVVTFIIDQGLEGKIINNFKDIVRSNIEPSFNMPEGKVTFTVASGDSSSTSNIKVSKGEESMLIWSIFYTILEEAIEELNKEENDRSMTIFNKLQYIIIDDPVSSIDDTKIVTMAIRLIDTIDSYQKKSVAINYSNSLKKYQRDSVKFFITTHHALFYNILVNSFKRDRDYNFKPYSLSKNNNIFKLSEESDSPFSYHLFVKETIQEAIDNNCIEKYHFNLFRNLLEKTANFLGYDNLNDCIIGENKDELARLVNVYSHCRLSDLETREPSSSDKDLLRASFGTFIQEFKWK